MKDITPIFGAVVSFSVTALLGFIVIPFLHKLKFVPLQLDLAFTFAKYMIIMVKNKGRYFHGKTSQSCNCRCGQPWPGVR